jgi:bifunctional N-acetylglucosamine-1-phosphate-uridyltransferase/glucosamine-1-phosphate-acetyltransferase GlmU-like protein
VQAIREDRDATERSAASAYATRGRWGSACPILRGCSAAIGNRNAKNEYYLTDVVSSPPPMGW